MQTHVISAPQPEEAVARLAASLSGPDAPQLIFAFYGEQADDQGLHQALLARWPGVPCLGGTSAGGLMTQEGLQDGRHFGLMAIEDRGGDYGVAAGPLGEDPASAAAALLQQALVNAGCEGELPSLIWIYQVPGHEEAVLEGLRRVVGERCPIVGGSAADESLSGAWRQFGPEGVLRDSLVVAVLFPSGALRYAFQGGYEPAGPSGVVTGIGFHPEGHCGTVTAIRGRELLSIDGQPAAEVYNHWLGGSIDAELEAGGAILDKTTLRPLATEVGQINGLHHFLLVHPESVTPQGALRTFCDLQVGDRIYAMRGERERLIDRAGRVALEALSELPPGGKASGALIVYCGGCRLAVGERIADVARSVRRQLGDIPFLGCFTYGEQGRLLDRNVHGNLMVSAVVLGG